LSPAARANTIEPTMVAIALVAACRASDDDLFGIKRARISIISLKPACKGTPRLRARTSDIRGQRWKRTTAGWIVAMAGG
jgi:hypothetical protein